METVINLIFFLYSYLKTKINMSLSSNDILSNEGNTPSKRKILEDKIRYLETENIIFSEWLEILLGDRLDMYFSNMKKSGEMKYWLYEYLDF